MVVFDVLRKQTLFAESIRIRAVTKILTNIWTGGLANMKIIGLHNYGQWVLPT